jgi:hypothetical protein
MTANARVPKTDDLPPHEAPGSLEVDSRDLLELLTVDEVAKLLKVSKSWVHAQPSDAAQRATPSHQAREVRPFRLRGDSRLSRPEGSTQMIEHGRPMTIVDDCSPQQGGVNLASDTRLQNHLIGSSWSASISASRVGSEIVQDRMSGVIDAPVNSKTQVFGLVGSPCR